MTAFILFVALQLTSATPAKYTCVKWTWTGDVYNRKVYCLEWKKLDDRK